MSKAMDAFNTQRRSAKRRGIPFYFTFDQWWAWWQIDNRWAQRGRGTDALVMARLGDLGAYEFDNVKCITHSENIIEANLGKRYPFATASIRQLKAWSDPELGRHLAVCGDGHPRSKAVITPKGRFGSAALASVTFGISARHAARLAANENHGWRYEESHVQKN